MKVSKEPVSAFAVYSEKLKQKRKRSKPVVSDAISKLKNSKVLREENKTKKTRVSTLPNKPNENSDKESWQMKEIGYILKTLAERSVDTSSPRAVALLNSINEANLKLGNEDRDFLEGTLKDVILVESLRDEAKSLKRKRGRKTENPDEDNFNNGLNTVLKKQPEKKKEDKLSAIKSKRTNEKKSKSKPPAKLVKKRNIDQIKEKSNTKVSDQPKNKSEDSITTAKKLFEWLTSPVTEIDFMRDFWEKKPLLIQRERNRHHYSELLCTEIIDTMLRENNVCFTKHLDVTSYSDGQRETHNLTGRAQANVVWDFYSNGCSVRLLNPQIFLPKIHALNATLQEYFGCFVGANVYLTPPNSQGFAPHYDDIEAFVLQIEGKKRWKVYKPRNDKEVLPRFSSRNFTQEEIGESFLDVTLEPGDLLYFPRGFIHQASTVYGEHSLHITLSAYQKTAWVDLLEKALPIALTHAAANDVEFRRGLPRGYLGLESHGSAREKQSFATTAQSLMEKLGHYLQLTLGAGVDKMGAQFTHDALPPVFTPGEKQSSSNIGGLKMKNGKLEGRVEFDMDTNVKLIRHTICRLVEEPEEIRLYHCLDNSLEYQGEEPQFLVLPSEGVPVIRHLQKSFPAFVSLSELPHEDPESLILLISDLWDAGLLSAKELQTVDED